MWKASVGRTLNNSQVNRIIAENSNDPDDWETDPDFVVSGLLSDRMRRNQYFMFLI